MELQKLLIVMQQKKAKLQEYFGNILEKLELEFQAKQKYVLGKFQSNEEEIELLMSLK